MTYRNKTYVAFASEDIRSYYLMRAWKTNANIDFNFYDAHELYQARDTSKPETIKRRLRDRIKEAKQVVLLGSANARRKGGDGRSFLASEIDSILDLDLPVVVANLNGSRDVERLSMPQPLLDARHYTISTSFQPAIIKYALDDYAANYARSANEGTYYYKASFYQRLGL